MAIEDLISSVPTGLWIGGEERAASSTFDGLDPSDDHVLAAVANAPAAAATGAAAPVSPAGASAGDRAGSPAGAAPDGTAAARGVVAAGSGATGGVMTGVGEDVMGGCAPSGAVRSMV